MTRLVLAPHSDIAFDVAGNLLVTSVVADPPGVDRRAKDGSCTRHYAQAWLRTPVARGAPALARMVEDTRWEIVDLEEHPVCTLEPPPGVACSRLTVNALSDDGAHAFGLTGAHTSRHHTMIVWCARSGEVLQHRPTNGNAPTAAFAATAPVLAWLVGGALECWRWHEDEVRVVAVGNGASDLATQGTVALVARGKTILRHELSTGEALEPWSLPLRSITSLCVRGDGVAVGAGSSILILRDGAVARRHKAAAKLVALAPSGDVASSDGTTLTWLASL